MQQTGNRFSVDNNIYDLTILERVSGTIPFRDRPKVKSNLTKLIEEQKVTELVVEEFSRLGRNTGDVIKTLEWLDDNHINVVIRNIGLQSRPNGKKNPIWKMISSVMSSLYEMELENIKERTTTGRMVYLQQGGRLGRPIGSIETEKNFLAKPVSQKIVKGLKKGLTIREIGKIEDCSTKTVQKVKALAKKYSLISDYSLA